MEKQDLTKLYQMINHNLNGLKCKTSPSFNAQTLTNLIDELIKKNNYVSDEYNNRYIQSIYENNEQYELFKTSDFTAEIELEDKINKCKSEMHQKINDIDEELLSAKRDGISKYKEKENIHIKKIHFINSNKKENKETYIKDVININNERLHAKQVYDESASDLSSKNEQIQYKYNHSIEARIKKNEKDKLTFEQYLKEKIEFLEDLLDKEIEKAKKEITDLELIIADKTIISNNDITKLSDDYKKRLQYAYIPYDIEHNKLLDSDSEKQKVYSLIEEQILNEFKTKLQENDNEIDKLRKEHNEYIAEYKLNIRKTKKEQNQLLKKSINDINREINNKTKDYNQTKNKNVRKEIKKLLKEKPKLTKEISKNTQKMITELKNDYLQKELDYIEKIEKLRTEKIKYETSKSNAMKNLNHERTYFQVVNSQKIKQILEEKDSFTATDKYEENIDILKLRLARDIEKANINKEINTISLGINSKKYQHKYLINKATVEKEYNEGLSNADLMYQRESNTIRKNFSNVSTMLEIQKNGIINKFEKLIFAEKMAIENTKFDYYTICDNIQYQAYRANYDYETKLIDNEIDFKTKIAEIKKQYLYTTNGLFLRQIKIEEQYNENLKRVQLYKSRFEIEKNMLQDAYLSFITSMNNLIEFENYLHSNFSSISIVEFEENKKLVLVSLEHIKQIKLELLDKYLEHELTVINSRINFENDLKFKKIIDNLKNEKKNFEIQINNRKDKLAETISSYQKTIKLFENSIKNKYEENKVIKENYHNASSNEKKEQRNKYKNNIEFIKDLKKQIKVNNNNIKELGNTSNKIEIEIKKHNKNYNKQIKQITDTLQNEAKVYTKNITLIRSQYNKIKSLINRPRYYTTRHKYTYINANKYSNKVINMNIKLLISIKNYFDIHYLKFINSITKEFDILQESYDRNFLHQKKGIDKSINDETNIYNTKENSIINSNKAIIEGLLRTHITNKKDLTLQIESNSISHLNKIKEHENVIKDLENKLSYELKCHKANFTSYNDDYKNALKDLTNKYSKTVEQLTKDYDNKILKLEIDKKLHDKNISNQHISLETIRKNTISDLNNEFQVSVSKTQNKINLIKDTDKQNKNKYEKQKKISLKKFVTEQLEIRNDFNKQENEINLKCLNRIKNNQKNFIKKIKSQK